MSTRRNFLQQAGLLSAAILVKPALSGCKAEPKVREIGIQLYSLRDEIVKDVKNVIARIAAAGYQQVETYGYSKDSGFFGLYANAFANLLKSHRLTSPSGHYGLDQFLKDGNTDDLKMYIDVANTLNQHYITVPYLGPEIRQNADDYKKIAASLNKAGEICEKAGLKLSYHNHDFEFQKFQDISGYEIMLKETDPKLLQFEMDIYWMVRAGLNPVNLIKKYPGRFVMWHVKDMDKAHPELNTEVGKGSINYKQIFESEKLSGLQYIFMEQENFTNIDPYTSIGQSYNYIKNQLLG